MGRGRKQGLGGSGAQYDRNFVMILYPDNPDHNEVLSKLHTYRYLSILHDEELENDEEGYLYKTNQEREENQEELDDQEEILDKEISKEERKAKPHYHVFLAFDNKRSREKLANDLGVEINLLRTCGNPNGYMLYMLHKGYPEKYQYPFSALMGDERLRKKVKKLMQAHGFDEEEKVESLLDWISEQEQEIDIMAFTRLALSSGKWDVIKRNQYLFQSIIRERNAQIFNKNNREQNEREVIDLLFPSQIDEKKGEKERWKKL